jgi:hypothetical protein
MAFISTEIVKKIRQEIKATFPKGWKFSITKEHHSSINVILLSSNIDDKEHESNYINTHYVNENKTPFGKVYQKIDEIVNRVGDYYDNSDIMTDYHNTAFYKNYSVGSWSKDYTYNAELPAFAAAAKYCPEVQMDHGTKDNFLQIWFSDKPAADILAELKTAGFRWNNRASCWWGLADKLPARYAEQWQQALEHIAATVKREEEHKQHLSDQVIKNSEDDKKRLVIERASNDHALANANKKIEQKFIPVSVFVQWSESGYFIENTLYKFADFEKLSRQAAKDCGENSGYYKTKVNILWSDGYEWNNARIDLAVGDESGAADHLKQYCDYYGNVNNKTGIADPQKHADEITAFLSTHHLNVPSDAKTNIIDFNQAKTDKKSDQFAEQLIDNLPEPTIYKTDALSVLLTQCEKIVYFSGDIEPGEARKIAQVEKSQLLRAASLQKFQVVDLHYIVRLMFDGDYFYDLYIENDTSKLLADVAIDIDQNHQLAAKAQTDFNKMIDKKLH